MTRPRRAAAPRVGSEEAEPRRRGSRVPTGRIERLARLGWMAGEIAAGGALARLRQAAGRPAEPTGLLLTAPAASRLAKGLSSLRGAAMKLGQMLSLEGDDLLPPAVSGALSALRDSAEPMPPSQLRRALGRAYGSGWEQRFRSFDFEPMAAASIGQVHAATTTDGRELALKVQFPGVAKSIDSDVDNLATALRLARILPTGADWSEVLREVKRQLRREADYLSEASHLERYAALLSDEPEIAIPRVHGDFTTPRVLAMDHLQGVPLEDLCGPAHTQDRRDAVGALLLRLLLRELLELRFMQTDPNFANFLWLPASERVGLLDLGAAQGISEELADCYAGMLRAVSEDDRSALRRTVVSTGIASADERPDRMEALLDLILTATEPLRWHDRYDFGRSDLPARVRDASARLVFGRGFRRPPPGPMLFVQRKVGGTFLLCARLGARVDARSLLRDALARARGGGRSRRVSAPLEPAAAAGA